MIQILNAIRAMSEDLAQRWDTTDPDLDDAVEAVVIQMAAIERRVIGVIREHHTSRGEGERLKPRYYCTCLNNLAVYHSGKNAGLCWACIKRNQRVARVQPDVIETARLVSRATVTCTTCWVDHPVPPGEDPQTWLANHKARCAIEGRP